MSSRPLLSVRDLGKTHRLFPSPMHRLRQTLFGAKRRYYTEFTALEGISFSVEPGQTLGVIGRNGAGKSTLLECLGGLTAPSSGEVLASGRLATLLELGAGYNPEFTGRENARLAATVLGLSDDQIARRFPSMEAFAGIGHFMDQPLRTYSSGMRARLAFAVAAHADADILLVDEVLAVGDAAFTQRCMRFLRAFKENGILVLVSHDISAVLALCDLVLWLDQGRMREFGPAKEICLSYMADLCGSSADLAGDMSRPTIPQVKSSRNGSNTRGCENTLTRGCENTLELFDFNPDTPGFGAGGVRIENVRFLDPDSGFPIAVLRGGEDVILTVRCKAQIEVMRPIVGFYVKDRLGQYLFGENTFLTFQMRPTPVKAKENFEAEFHFRLPYLPSGDYSLCAAVADGDQNEHVQHHWLDEALIFRVESSHVVRGLVGLPMDHIALSRLGNSAE